MTDLHIARTHTLGLEEIRKFAFSWAELVEREHGLTCVYQEGDEEDELTFTGPGIRGLLLASSEKLVIQVKLGIFLGALKSNLEIEINKQLDLHL